MSSIEGLRRAMKDISAKKGAFTFFGLLRRPGVPHGLWDLVVSAPWLESGTLKATKGFAQLLRKSIGETVFTELARIQTVDSDSPALARILETYSVDDVEVRVQRTILFGLEIDEAIILRAREASARKASGRSLQPTGGR